MKTEPGCSVPVIVLCYFLRLVTVCRLQDFIIVNKSGRVRREEHVARSGEIRNVQKFLVGKHEGDRRLGRPRRSWEDEIKIDLEDSRFNWLMIGPVKKFPAFYRT